MSSRLALHRLVLWNAVCKHSYHVHKIHLTFRIVGVFRETCLETLIDSNGAGSDRNCALQLLLMDFSNGREIACFHAPPKRIDWVPKWSWADGIFITDWIWLIQLVLRCLWLCSVVYALRKKLLKCNNFLLLN